MIAPLRETERHRAGPRRGVPPGLRAARRLVLHAMLHAATGLPETPRVPAWRAWIGAAWVIGVVISYLAAMLL